jgi:hypothetical protein
MLQNGGNPWRGMVYGITNRKGWGGANPSEIWKFWDDYAIADKSMIGYWDQNNPVKVSNDLIKATLYKGDRECIIAVANWKQEDQFCSVDIDWKKLNIKSKDYTCFMPAISGFQENNPSVHLKELRIPGGKGFLIVLRSND